MAQPPAMLAEVDIGQVIFVIVFLVVGFIQWVIKTIKEKAEAAANARRVPTAEETAARRTVWEEQSRSEQESEPEPYSPSPSRPAPHGGGLGDLLNEFKKAVQEAQAPELPAPPPLPQRPLPPRHQPPPEFPKPAPEVRPLAPVAPASVHSSQPYHDSSMARPRLHPLAAMLRTNEGYRQAFVLREVLGPPRGFQEYRGPED